MYKNSRGFSLLEVLVAFVVLALVLGVLMQIFSGGIRNIRSSSEYQQAVLIGQSKLETLGVEVPLQAGVIAGDYDAKYRWQVIVSPYDEPGTRNNIQVGTTPTSIPVKLLQVDVSIFWGERTQPRSIHLQTLRLVSEVMP